jgi:hypothetical protein
MAVVDSMASVSFISPKLAVRLNFKIDEVYGRVTLGSEGSSTAILGTCDHIDVEIGHQRFLYRFEVLNLHDHCDLYLWD